MSQEIQALSIPFDLMKDPADGYDANRLVRSHSAFAPVSSQVPFSSFQSRPAMPGRLFFGEDPPTESSHRASDLTHEELLSNNRTYSDLYHKHEILAAEFAVLGYVLLREFVL